MMIDTSKRNLMVVAIIGMILLGGTAIPATSGTSIAILWRDYPHELNALKEMIIAFQALRPEIDVELIPSSQGEYEAKLYVLHVSGNPPDIFSSVGMAGLADFVHNGLVFPLDDWVVREKVLFRDFLPGSLDALRIDGRLYGVPAGGVPSLMYYNRRLFDKAGVAYPPATWETDEWNWSDMLSTAQKLTLDQDGDGLMDVYGVYMNLWPAVANAWLWGGDWFPLEAYQTGIADRTVADSVEVARSLQAQVDLMYTYHVMPQPGTLQVGDFAASKFAMGADGGWVTRNWAKIPDLEWSIAPLPRGVHNIRNAIFTDPWLIASGSRQKETAWEWVKYAVSTKGQMIWSPSFAGVPIRRDQIKLLESKFPAIAANVLRDVFWGAWSYAQESPNHSIAGWSQLEPLINEGLAGVWTREASPEAALAGLVPRVNAMLSEIKQGITAAKEAARQHQIPLTTLDDARG
jgi:multiple sugar transport system substrate-binding protein